MEALGQAESLDELLRLVRRHGSPSEVLRWLGRRIGADVAWIGRQGAVEAATAGFPGGSPTNCVTRWHA